MTSIMQANGPTLMAPGAIRRLLSSMGAFVSRLRKNRVFRTLQLIVAVGYPVFIVLAVELMHFGSAWRLMDFIAEKWSVLLFDIVFIWLLYAVLLMLVRYVVLAAVVPGVFFFIMSLASHNKYMARSEYLYPWDIFMAREAGDFALLANITMSTYMKLCLGLIIACLLFMLLGGLKLKLRMAFSLPGCAAGISLLILLVVYPPISFEYLPKADAVTVFLTDKNIDQNANYKQNGLLGGFTLNLGNLIVGKPTGFIEGDLERVLGEYPGVDNPDYTKPDIIVILSEAFWDPTVINGSTFSRDPLENYHALLDMPGVHSLKMISNTYGGGTLRPELELLSGITDIGFPAGSIPYEQYITKPFWTYMWHFKDMGYDTKALHTFKRDFYNRSAVYPLMGFDEFVGMEDMEQKGYELRKRAGLVLDEVFTEVLTDMLDTQDDDPLFLFGITMQSHGPYIDKYTEHSIGVTNPLITEDELNYLTNYCEGLLETDEQLMRLYNYVQNRDRPTVVVYFGDHLPAIGVFYDLYYHSGNISSSDSSKWGLADNTFIYGMPCIVFSNYDTGRDFPATPELGLSPYYVMSVLCDYIGAPTSPFVGMLSANREKLPVANWRYYVPSHGLPEEDISDIINFHWMLSYDRILGSGYSNGFEVRYD